MEALTAVSIAALTVYDMCKAGTVASRSKNSVGRKVEVAAAIEAVLDLNTDASWARFLTAKRMKISSRSAAFLATFSRLIES